MNESEAILKLIRDKMRRKGCVVSYDTSRDKLLFVNNEHGTLSINKDGNFIFTKTNKYQQNEHIVEFNHNTDPVDKFLVLYDLIYDDIREDNKTPFMVFIISILINVILWAFIFCDIHPVSIIFWLSPLIMFSMKYCREYIKVALFKIGGKLCLI